MLTKEEVLRRMEEIDSLSWDKEVAHSNADDLLCDILDDLGMQEVTEWFKGLDKWYA